jgi:hypothetical protein
LRRRRYCGILEAMPVSFEFLRGVLGILGVACGFMAGRSLAAVRKGWEKPPRLYGWIIRGVLCLGAIVLRHPMDGIAIAVWVGAALAFAAGYWQTLHQKPPEDLTGQIFPHQP